MCTTFHVPPVSMQSMRLLLPSEQISSDSKERMMLEIIWQPLRYPKQWHVPYYFKFRCRFWIWLEIRDHSYSVLLWKNNRQKIPKNTSKQNESKLVVASCGHLHHSWPLWLQLLPKKNKSVSRKYLQFLFVPRPSQKLTFFAKLIRTSAPLKSILSTLINVPLARVIGGPLGTDN